MIDARRVTAAGGIDRHPQVDPSAIERSESWLHHSNDGRDHALDGETFPQHLRIAVELSLPELVADQDGLSAVLRFRRKKNSPQNRLPPPQPQKIRGHIYRPQPPCLPPPR